MTELLETSQEPRIHWLTGHEGIEEIRRICLELLGTDLHPAALMHLEQATRVSAVPYPRLETHGSYLFGVFYLPANVHNPAADYDSVTFVATHESVVATIGRHDTSQRDWDLDRTLIMEVDSSDSTPDGGQFILNSLRLITHDLTADAREVVTYLQQQVSSLRGSVDLTTNISSTEPLRVPSTGDRREMQRQLVELLPFATAIKREIPIMKRVADETCGILVSLVENDPTRDLQRDLQNRERELFSRELEIYLNDILLDARQLLASLDELSSLIETIFARGKQLNEQENVAAARFTGAIASIMLLPTFVVGLYGQNFASMPERNWRYGYLFSWGAIALLTTFQVAFFRRRRWI